MRIGSVDVTPLDIDLVTPFGIATGAQVRANNLLVRVMLDDGTTGFGEAAPFPAVNGETQAMADAALRAAIPALVGTDARRWRDLAAIDVPSARFALETAVERACHAPAVLFGVEQRGFIREGYWADLVVVDANKPYTVKAGNLLYQCGWSPLEGHTFGSTIERTFVNGVCVFEDGKIRADAPKGMRLSFNGNVR